MKPMWDRDPKPKAAEQEVDCPKCGARVGVEVIVGRYRTVTTTVVHIKKGSPTATVCHAILKTKEAH